MAIDHLFELTHGGVTKSLADWGVTLATESRGSMQVDTVTLGANGMMLDANAQWNYGDVVQIRRSGVLWFQGKVRSTARSGAPQSEGISYTVAGVWDELEQATMMVEWAGGTNPNAPDQPLTVGGVYMSHVPLYVDANGERISLAQTMAQVFSYASSVAGINVQAGTLPDTIIPWPSDAKDQTIAQVIRTLMKWQPSAVAQVDYSTTPPTINFIKRSAAQLLTVDGSGEGILSQITMRSRPDLVPPTVCITYNRDNQFAGKSYRDIKADQFPTSGNCAAPRALNVSVPLRGIDVVQEVVSVNVAGIPDNPKRLLDIGNDNGASTRFGSNSISGRSWWKRHHPKFQKFQGANDLLIFVDAVDGVVFAEELPEDHPPEPLFKGGRRIKELPKPEDYPNELVHGALDDWMRVHSRELKITAKIYFGGTEAEFQALTNEEQAIFGFVEAEPLMLDFEDGKKEVVGKHYTIEYVSTMATDAVTKNYDRTTSALPAEEFPVGLAEHYYNELKTVHWDGNITLTEKEMSEQKLIGKVVNITGTNRNEWTTMRAQIQRVSYNYDSGSTTLTVGPPKHLSIQDTLQQLSLEKSNPLVPELATGNSAYDPQDGSSKSDKIVGGYITPKVNTETVNAAGGSGDTCSNLKVTLTPNDSAYDLAVTPGTVDTTTLMHTSSVTAPTKVWIVVDGLAGVTENPAGSGVFEYDGTVTLSNHRIVVQVADPTSIPSTAPTSASDVAMVYAMLAAEIYDDNGTLKLRATKCGDRVTKWCPPQSFYFNPT